MLEAIERHILGSTGVAQEEQRVRLALMRIAHKLAAKLALIAVRAACHDEPELAEIYDSLKAKAMDQTPRQQIESEGANGSPPASYAPQMLSRIGRPRWSSGSAPRGASLASNLLAKLAPL